VGRRVTRAVMAAVVAVRLARREGGFPRGLGARGARPMRRRGGLASASFLLPEGLNQ
jgi:hypothetical protein